MAPVLEAMRRQGHFLKHGRSALVEIRQGGYGDRPNLGMVHLLRQLLLVIPCESLPTTSHTR